MSGTWSSYRAARKRCKASRGLRRDVIVSDMRMPGMDGWQLLAEVKTLYPQTVRLVLSGYAEPGAIMRLVGTAHQYIAKPGGQRGSQSGHRPNGKLMEKLAHQRYARLAGG